MRCIDDFQTLLRTGADKIAINTQACATPDIITAAAKIFGAQCVIVSIEAKRQPSGNWEPYTQNGRGRTSGTSSIGRARWWNAVPVKFC